MLRLLMKLWLQLLLLVPRLWLRWLWLLLQHLLLGSWLRPLVSKCLRLQLLLLWL